VFTINIFSFATDAAAISLVFLKRYNLQSHFIIFII